MLSLSTGLSLTRSVKSAPGTTTYATWNPSDKDAAYTLSNGNKTVTRTGSSDNTSLRATLPKTTGKWYFELTFPDGLLTADGAVSFSSSTTNILGTYPGAVADSIIYTANSTVPVVSSRFTGYNMAIELIPTSATTVGVAVDLDTRVGWIYTGTSWNNGNPSVEGSQLFAWSESFPICITQRLYYQNVSCILNAGQDPFTYSVPAGYNSGWYE